MTHARDPGQRRDPIHRHSSGCAERKNRAAIAHVVAAAKRLRTHADALLRTGETVAAVAVYYAIEDAVCEWAFLPSEDVSRTVNPDAYTTVCSFYASGFYDIMILARAAHIVRRSHLVLSSHTRDYGGWLRNPLNDAVGQHTLGLQDDHWGPDLQVRPELVRGGCVLEGAPAPSAQVLRACAARLYLVASARGTLGKGMGDLVPFRWTKVGEEWPTEVKDQKAWKEVLGLALEKLVQQVLELGWLTAEELGRGTREAGT